MLVCIPDVLSPANVKRVREWMDDGRLTARDPFGSEASAATA